MNVYSIKDLERLSGIKAHTLRAWERRYDLLTPLRSDTNIRSYGDSDLRKLLNISTLIQSGWKISHASQLNTEELKSEVVSLQSNLPASADNFTPFVNSLLIAALELNSESFNQTFTAVITRFGIRETMLQIINPLLRKIGLMWAVWKAHPGQEHFASNLIRQKLFAAIDQLPVLQPKPKKFMLFLPEDEHHEIGLLFAYYLLRTEGYSILYLGQDTPFDAVTRVAEVQQPDCLLTFFIAERPVDEIQNYLEKLAEFFPNQSIYIAGSNHLISKLKLASKVHWLSSPEALLAIE